MLLVQPADEIRALVAHELSTLHPVETELVAHLFALPDAAEGDRLTRLLHRRRPTSYRPVRTVRRLVAELETRADAAASRIAGSRNAAIAQVKEARLSVDCQNLVDDVEEELGDGGCDAGLVDVFTQWLDRLRRYGPEYPMSVDRLWRAGMTERHPGLATAIADLRPDELDPDAGDQLVELAPFSADQAHALAADAFNQPHEQWMTTAEIPESVWRAAIQAEGRHILESVAESVDRKPNAVGEAMAMACSVLPPQRQAGRAHRPRGVRAGTSRLATNASDAARRAHRPVRHRTRHPTGGAAGGHRPEGARGPDQNGRP